MSHVGAVAPQYREMTPNFGPGLAIIGVVYAGLAVTVVIPLLSVLVQAFSDGGGFDVDNLKRVMTSATIIRAVGNTISISVLTVIIAAALGVSLAWLNARTDMPFKRFFEPLNMIPFYLSSIVGALSWQVVAAPRSGLLNNWLAPFFDTPPFNIYSIWGISLVLGIFYTPYIYLFTLGSLRSMDASLEEAARISGASVIQTALRVTIPLSAPAIISSCMLVFVTAAGIFGVPLVLGTPARISTLSTLIYDNIISYPSDYGTAAILSLGLFLFVLILTLIQIRILRGRAFTTVTGKGYRPQTVNLGRYGWVGVGANGIYLLFVLGPFLALVMVSFMDAWVGHFELGRLTLQNYYHVLFLDETARRGFFNSMFISPVGATISVFICLALALVVQRTRLPGRSGIVWLTLLPLTVPGVVLGLGFLIAYLQNAALRHALDHHHRLHRRLPADRVPQHGGAGARGLARARRIGAHVRRQLAAIHDAHHPAAGGARYGGDLDADVRRLHPRSQRVDDAVHLRHRNHVDRADPHHGLRGLWHFRRVRRAADDPASQLRRGDPAVLEYARRSQGEWLIERSLQCLRLRTRPSSTQLPPGACQVGCSRRRAAGTEAARQAGASASPVLVENLVKGYGEVLAVRNVSFTVEPGTTATLLGPSGCGKTTTLRCIAGLEVPSCRAHHDRRARSSSTTRPSASSCPRSARSAWCFSPMRSGRT